MPPAAPERAKGTACGDFRRGQLILIDVCSVKRAARRNLLHFFGKRVFIAGLGDSGVLTAIKLARHADVVGISAKPALVSGPELGSRLTGPDLLAPEPIDTAKTIGLMGTTAACDLTSRPTLRKLRGLVLMKALYDGGAVNGST